MTEPVPSVVTPYDRFLEYQNRRRKLAAELTEHQSPTIDADVVSVPDAGGISPDAEPVKQW